MRRFRLSLTALLLVLVLIEALIGYRLWDSGWPSNVSVSAGGDGSEIVQVERLRFGALDWFVVALLIAGHALLAYMVWRAWRADRVRL
ncbi:MAG: hypothetical protein KIT09_36090 [Bryobacteraceae bacterium]|nr:hypothetical protein [Bryobacteraceae bacterium]